MSGDGATRRPAPPTGLRAVWVAAATSSAGALRGRRLWGVAALVALPLVIQIAFLLWGEGRGQAFNHFAKWVNSAILGVIVPLTTIFLGTAAFGDEWEGGTAGYVIGAPLSRGALVVGRWFAAVRRALVLLLPAIALLFVLCVLSFEGALEHYLPDVLLILGVAALAIAAYIAVFVCFGILLRRSVVTALGYVLVFEGFISRLPQGFAFASLSYHARNLLWLGTGHDAFEPLTLERNQEQLVDPTTATESLLMLGAVIVATLALTTFVLRRKEFAGSATAGESAPG
ncbi:MAG: ABC transporter permease [Planctomycetota bacterium]